MQPSTAAERTSKRRLGEGLVLAVTFSLIAWGGLILLVWFLM